MYGLSCTFRNNQEIGKSTLVKPCIEIQIRNYAVQKYLPKKKLVFVVVVVVVFIPYG